ncbi:hypothetical protein SDC9_118215 [bioreactor metagenome]|uniref:PepSY domain-containing protein n=1 Tax=bioreactor metagenome TaxID=1076179 RepID=A0A645C0W3_9ZZZZ
MNSSHSSSSLLNRAARVAVPMVFALAAGGAAMYATAQDAAVAPAHTAPAASAAITSTTSATTSATTSPASALNIRQIYDRMEAAGYSDIRQIEWDDGRYEVKARNPQGKRVKLYVNGDTGTVERTKTGR